MLRSTIHLTTCRGRRILVIYYVKLIPGCHVVTAAGYGFLFYLLRDSHRSNLTI